MRLTPTYSFNDLLSKGINEVPIFSNVIVENDGNHQTKIYMKISNDGITSDSTINDFLSNRQLFYSYESENQSINPTINDDITKNYRIGHIWINNLSNDIFILSDNTAGSAVWSKTNKYIEYDIYNKINYIANGGETSYNIKYDIGFIDIFNDGNKMVDILDFTANNGTSIEFKNPLEKGNIITLQVWKKTDNGLLRSDNASDILTNTNSFNNNLSNADNTVQKALDTLDNINIQPSIDNASDILTNTNSFNNNLSNADNTVQKALDTLDNLDFTSTNINLITNSFNNNLSVSDDTIQKAFNTLDSMNINQKAPDSFKLDGYDRINLFDSVRSTDTQSGTVKIRLDGTTAYITTDGTDA